MAVMAYCHRCGGVVEQGHKHRVKDRRPSARARGYDHKWRQTRGEYLRMFPVCQWHEGCIAEATQVHHLDGEGPKGECGHDWGNLQGLCASHHARITSEEQPGGWNAPGYVREW